MARKRIYNHNRFDGGMTDSPRDTSNLTKMAYISHLDIYRDTNRMFVMPGYESFNGFASDANGIKQYSIQDVAPFANTKVMALGKKSDGTGSKIFEIEPADTEWKAPTLYDNVTEGSDNLVVNPFLVFTRDSEAIPHFPVVVSGQVRISRFGFSGYDNTTYTTNLGSNIASPIGRHNVTSIRDDMIYFNIPGIGNVRSISDIAVNANAKSTGQSILDLAAGDYTIALAGAISGRRARNLIWDSASLLADQNNSLGRGLPQVAMQVSGMPVFVLDEFVTAGTFSTFLSNGTGRMAVKALMGETVETVYSLDGFRNSGNDIYNTKGVWRNSPTWYARIAQDDDGTEFRQGVWAYGKNDIDSQFGVSVLLDTSSLGYVRNTRWIGNTCWLVNHSGDGSISRLQDFETGTYNVPATIETLIYGADSPFLKELNGVSVVTEDLPSGGSVVCSYRKDEDDAWTTMGTSSTAGTRKHNFTKANGTPIGRFQEIQFKIVITGKTAVKNIMVSVTETDDLPFN